MSRDRKKETKVDYKKKLKDGEKQGVKKGKQTSELNQGQKETKKRKVFYEARICKECQGCSDTREAYQDTLKRKQKKLQLLLGEFCKVDEIMGMEHPVHYKNKVLRLFHHEKNGTPMCGTIAKDGKSVVKIEDCLLEDEKAQEIVVTIRSLLKSFKIKTFDVNTGYGLLRYVLVRRSVKKGEIMVVLVLSSPIMPSKNNFVKALRKEHPEIDTVLISENYKNTTVALGDKETAIYGKGFILDEMGGKIFRISSKSLYPINPIQGEKLYQTAISWCDFSGEEIVLDAFCGIGAMGILASNQVRRVISVDGRPEVIRDGIANVKRNQIKNIDFYTKEVAEFIGQVAESNRQPIQVAFIQCPITGCEEGFLKAMVKVNPKKIIYIAKNLEQQVEDLKFFTKHGYQVQRAVGVDMLPWTGGVETCVLLSRKKI